MILPTHLLDTGDELEFGQEYVLLSKLHRLGFPSATGFVVSPPLQEIKHFIVDHDVKSLRDFESKRESFLNHLINYAPEMHLLSEEEKGYLLHHWSDLSQKWISSIHSHFVRFDSFSPKHFHLQSLPILLSSRVIAAGSAFWDTLSKQIIIELHSGELDHAYLAYIDDMVQKANRKLGLKYTFQFIVNSEGLKFTRLEHLKHQIIGSNTSPKVNSSPGKIKSNRKIKLYVSFSGNFVVDEYCDGYLLESDQFRSHDEKQLVLLESMIAKQPQIILYQISERYIKSDAAAIKLCRNLKKQDNLEVVFKADEGKEKLFQLKRDLSAEGVTRKGKLKFWLRAALPGIVMQIEDFIGDDFDGVIFDIDFIAAALHARDITEQGNEADIEGLIRFLDPLIKKLNKQKIPIILQGKLVSSERVIKQAVKWNISGLAVQNETEKMDSVIAYQEQIVDFGLS